MQGNLTVVLYSLSDSEVGRGRSCLCQGLYIYIVTMKACQFPGDKSDSFGTSYITSCGQEENFPKISSQDWMGALRRFSCLAVMSWTIGQKHAFSRYQVAVICSQTSICSCTTEDFFQINQKWFLEVTSLCRCTHNFVDTFTQSAFGLIGMS